MCRRGSYLTTLQDGGGQRSTVQTSEDLNAGEHCDNVVADNWALFCNKYSTAKIIRTGMAEETILPMEVDAANITKPQPGISTDLRILVYAKLATGDKLSFTVIAPHLFLEGTTPPTIGAQATAIPFVQSPKGRRLSQVAGQALVNDYLAMMAITIKAKFTSGVIVEPK